MKMTCILNPDGILHFGNASLIKREDGKHELVGGDAEDYTQAKEWVSLFAHEIVFSRPTERRQHQDFAMTPSPV